MRTQKGSKQDKPTTYSRRRTNVRQRVVREATARAYGGANIPTETEKCLEWLNAIAMIADLVRRQGIAGEELEQLLQEMRAREKARHCATLSAATFNRVWDNPADAEAWDNWRPPSAKKSK